VSLKFSYFFVFDWACMPTVYCYPVKLTIADLIRVKSICSQSQFSHIINRLLTSLVRSVLWNIRPLFFAWTSLLRRSVHQTSRSVNKPLFFFLRSEIIFYVFWNLIDFASGPYEPARTARDLMPWSQCFYF
jgi:hypothetical protein